MRLVDLILAFMVFWALLFVARHQFPVFEGKSFTPVSQVASPSPVPTP